MDFNLLNFLSNNIKDDDPLAGVLQRAKGAKVTPVTTPEEGGTFSNFQGGKYPFPGFPDSKAVNLIGSAKRMIPIGANIIDASLRGLQQEKDIKRMCKTAREIHRIFDIMIEREQVGYVKENFTKIRDMICFILEYDDAYRFRFQDAFSELNVDEIKLTTADKYWFSNMNYNYPGKEEHIKEHGTPSDDYEK